MTPERWHQVERIYHALLERGAEGRAAYLVEACAGDEALRREVESLLAYEGQAEQFIESPALEVTAKIMAEKHRATVMAGKTVNHYRVTAPLGEGGMGEVYLAEDSRLGRRVALKFLPAHLTEDIRHLNRFQQEARAVAALSHPNVCMIHEVIETVEGRHCIVMEYVDGLTLRERLAEGMKIREALDAAIQVAAALSAAHTAGIVHRDIKPENIIIRRDGYVKILDFGLAKLSERQSADADVGASARTMVDTWPGVVMGTANYMSPEQARGLAVDVRTDVWSLGVVLHEMVTGQRPFAGDTPTDVIIAIVEREPVPLTRWAPDFPIQLERIVLKALAKDREERYQTAEELLGDLNSLKQELEIEAVAGRYKEPTPNRASATTTTRQLTTSRTLLPLTRSRILILSLVVGMLIVAGLVSALFFPQSSPAPQQSEIKSLAVLPLKSLNREAGDDHLGLGIANTIITKVSQVGELTVRPTSAVSKYADQEIDAIEAARQLHVDAVLDGTFMHSGDQLRVSVNLLRVRDGASLWAQSFDMRFTDIFTIQDRVSQEVANRLQFTLSSADQARLSKRYTSKPEAYSYYTKAMYHFSKRAFSGYSQEEADTAIDLFKKAIELDSNYALAHAQLGFAYAWIADFKEAGPDLIASAKEELRLAERLDPQLADVHVARSFIAWSHYEDWQIEAAIREARLAKQLDPSIPPQVLAALYFHVGLEEQSDKESEWGLEQDPTSDVVKRTYLSAKGVLAKPDEWLALNQRLFNRGADTRYYLEKRMLTEAAPLIEQEYVKNPDEPEPRRDKALLAALQGKHREAQAAVPRILEKVRRDKAYHHYTYDIARIYALGGKREEALKWLRITVKEGFPCYPLFARDSFLDPIRKDQGFIQFMSEMQGRWEGYQREFGNSN